MHKRLLICILILLVSLCMSACSDEDNVAFKQSFYEYNLAEKKFTDNNILNLTIPAGYSSGEQKIDNADVYLGIYTKDSSTISIIQRTDLDSYDESIYAYLNDNWTFKKEYRDSLRNAFYFYNPTDNYILIIKVENTKQNMSLEEAMQVLIDLTGEEMTIPEIEQDLTVTTSISSPAAIDEWVTVDIRNSTSNKIEPVIIKIDNIYSVEQSEQILTDYINIHKLDKSSFKNGKDICYYVFDYEIFFSDFYTSSDTGIEKVKIPFSLTNTSGNTTINGYPTGLSESVIDISEQMENVQPNSIWTGRAVFKMSQDFTRFLLKIQEEGQDAIYFNFYK